MTLFNADTHLKRTLRAEPTDTPHKKRELQLAFEYASEFACLEKLCPIFSLSTLVYKHNVYNGGIMVYNEQH